MGLGSAEDADPPDPDDVSGEALPDDPRTGDDWPHCEVCGDAIEWSGRGRKPKKCVEHRRRTSAGSGNAGGPTTRRLSRAENDRLGRIQAALASQGFKFGVVSGRFIPVTGLTIAKRSDKFAESLVKLCANKPEYLDILEKAAAFEPVFDIAEFVGAVVIAVGVDMGQVHPEGMAARMLGVTETWMELADDEAMTQEEPNQPQYQGANVGDSTPKAPMFGPGILPAFQPIAVGV